MNNRSSYFEAIDNTKAITSTRDNSIVGILNEDISVIDLLDDTTDLAINTRETLEEVLISPTKNQFSADSKGEIQEEMNKLEKKTIDKETQKEEKDQSKEDTVQNKECNQINEGTNNEQHTPKKENNETHRKEAEEQDKKKKEEGEIKIDDEIEVKNVDIKVHTENRPVTVELSTCILCGFESGDNNSLEDHMKLSHDQNKSPKEARNHIFSCASCGFTSKTSRGLDRHIENRCSQCNICLAGNIEQKYMRVFTVSVKRTCVVLFLMEQQISRIMLLINIRRTNFLVPSAKTFRRVKKIYWSISITITESRRKAQMYKKLVPKH